MRRFLISLLSVSYLVAMCGCWHGVCDCLIGTDWCIYPRHEGNSEQVDHVGPGGPVAPGGLVAPGGPGVPVPIVNGGVPIAPGEQLKEMPKEIQPGNNNEPPAANLPGQA